MKKNFNEALGARLKQVRKEKGFSQEYIAQCMKVTKMAVSYWESGKRAMYADSLQNYCNILGCRMQEIFDGMEDFGS